MAGNNELKVRVLGRPRTPLSDAHHILLRSPWWLVLILIVGVYLTLNMAFGAVYYRVGGIKDLPAHSYWDAFFFSVQTMGPIGYGAMYPVSRTANIISVGEAITGLLVAAISTGLVFSKFSQARGRIVFTRQVVISPMNGVPTLALRVGNERSNRIIQAQIDVVLFRTEHTQEGKTYYRMYDVPLVRSRSPALARSWSVLHEIKPGSPLHGLTPAAMKQNEVELLVTVMGMDDTSLQSVHGQRRYTDDEVVWGARHVDILVDEGESLTLDLRRFHDIEPSEPLPDFPYPPAKAAGT
jgi:inward rectifier potassium channel